MQDFRNFPLYLTAELWDQLQSTSFDFVTSAQGGTALHLFGAILGSQARIRTDTICHCVFAWWEHAGWTTKCAAADNQVTLAHGGDQGQEHGSAAAG